MLIRNKIGWMLGYMMTCLPAFAQTVHVQPEQTIFIGDQAIFSVQGGVQNEGSIFNNGTVQVSGDWINNGIYNTAAGVVVLNGEDVQSINNNNQTIYDLICDGGGEKVLADDLVVNNRVLLKNGIVNTENGVLQLEKGATISTENNNSFVNGPLVQQGTGYHFYPIGKNGNYSPIYLLDVKGVEPVLQVEVQETAPESAELDETLKAISAVRYWQVSTLEGTYRGSIVEASVGEDENFETLEGAVVVDAIEAGQPFTNLGQSERNETNRTITSKEASTGSIMAIGLTALFVGENEILVPSAFSPYAANPDDQKLVIFGNNLDNADFTFRIFNRWNKLVYETNSIAEATNAGWDGYNTATGQPAQAGVYTYLLRARVNGKVKEMAGTITLIR